MLYVTITSTSVRKHNTKSMFKDEILQYDICTISMEGPQIFAMNFELLNVDLLWFPKIF